MLNPQSCRDHYRCDMRHVLLWMMLCLTPFMLLGQQPFECRGQFFSTHGETLSSPSQLVEISIDAISTEIIFDTIASLAVNVNAIGFRSTDRLIYGIDPIDHTLYQIDAEGTSTLLGIPEGLPDDVIFLAGDCSPDGRFLVLVALKGGSQGRDQGIIKIDLSQPTYPVTFTLFAEPNSSMTDIAFDPITGLLYGFDGYSDRLLLVDPDLAVITIQYPSISAPRTAGGIFFDAFGQLYAYGNLGTGPQNALYKVNKTSGTFTFIGIGPTAIGNDACSCPFVIAMQKSVVPEVVEICAKQTWYFAISNLSGAEKSGIAFTDTFPDGMVIRHIDQNPFGGTINSGIGSSILSIEGMTISVGLDTLIVQTTAEIQTTGMFTNQAYLDGPPLEFGNRILSDNPRTGFRPDLTAFEVVPITLDLPDTIEIYPGIPIVLSLPETGLEYQWQDGSTTMMYSIIEPGTYNVLVTSPCTTFTKTIIAIQRAIPPSIIDRDLLYVPNVFSPNGDGINELLTIGLKEGVLVQFSVFGRAGDLLYRSRNIIPNSPSSGWNGESKGRALPTGVYTWMAVIRVGELSQVIAGDVTLIR